MKFAMAIVLCALAGASCSALVAAYGSPMAYLLIAAFGGGIVLWGNVE